MFQVIQHRSSADNGRFSEDLIRYAARVLVKTAFEKQHDHVVSEKRRVIKETTANERRGSLVDEVRTLRIIESFSYEWEVVTVRFVPCSDDIVP